MFSSNSLFFCSPLSVSIITSILLSIHLRTMLARERDHYICDPALDLPRRLRVMCFWRCIAWKRRKGPHPHTFSLTKKMARFKKGGRGFSVRTKSALHKTGHFLCKAERVGVGAFSPLPIGRTPRGSCNRTLLRKVLRRFSNSKCFLEGFLEGTW